MISERKPSASRQPLILRISRTLLRPSRTVVHKLLRPLRSQREHGEVNIDHTRSLPKTGLIGSSWENVSLSRPLQPVATAGNLLDASMSVVSTLHFFFSVS